MVGDHIFAERLSSASLDPDHGLKGIFREASFAQNFQSLRHRAKGTTVIQAKQPREPATEQQRPTCRRTLSLSYSGSIAPGQPIRILQRAEPKGRRLQNFRRKVRTRVFVFSGQIRSVRPGRHERAGTATVAARRTRFQICFCHQWYAPSTADRFPNMPLQYRAAVFTCVLGVAAIIGVCERLVALWASQHGYLTYHVTGQFL